MVVSIYMYKTTLHCFNDFPNINNYSHLLT